jgi:TolB protein
MNRDGTNVIRLTDGSGGYSPEWSPDGTQIVFNRDDEDVYKMDADGSFNNLKRLTWDGTSLKPDWSPDGTRIVFRYAEHDYVPKGQIKVRDVVNGGDVTLTGEHNGNASLPAWSPDGTKIAYTSNLNDIHERQEIWVMNSDGTNKVRLTSESGWEDYSPTWSPDGSQIAFISREPGNAGQIFVLNASGQIGDPIKLTTLSRNESPSWSR